MKKKLIYIIAGVAIIGVGAALFTGGVKLGTPAIGDARMSLPEPNIQGGAILRTINARKSTKEFDKREISEQILSDVLWAAWGVNSDGKRTIPTSRNRQDLTVYAIMPHGAFLYDAPNNELVEITGEDLRPLFATQDYVMDAYLTLVYVGTDIPNATLHAGSAYQNVALYAADAGL